MSDLISSESIHGDLWRARIRAEHERLGPRCPCHNGEEQPRPNAVLDDENRLIGWRDEPDAHPYVGTKTVREVLRERGEEIERA